MARKDGVDSPPPPNYKTTQSFTSSPLKKFHLLPKHKRRPASAKAASRTNNCNRDDVGLDVPLPSNVYDIDHLVAQPPFLLSPEEMQKWQRNVLREISPKRRPKTLSSQKRYDTEKQNVQLFPRMQPNQRSDILLLEEWYRSKLDEMGVPSTDPAAGLISSKQAIKWKHVDGFQKILTTVAHEISRQVCVSCVERGELLADIWLRMSGMIGDIRQNAKNHYRELEKTSERERMEYAQNLSKLQKQAKERELVLKNEIAELKEDINRVVKIQVEQRFALVEQSERVREYFERVKDAAETVCRRLGIVQNDVLLNGAFNYSEEPTKKLNKLVT